MFGRDSLGEDPPAPRAGYGKGDSAGFRLRCLCVKALRKERDSPCGRLHNPDGAEVDSEARGTLLGRIARYYPTKLQFIPNSY
jgi:hypothetical protein